MRPFMRSMEGARGVMAARTVAPKRHRDLMEIILIVGFGVDLVMKSMIRRVSGEGG